MAGKAFLSYAAGRLPDVPVYVLVAGGVGFAAVNALGEDLLVGNRELLEGVDHGRGAAHRPTALASASRDHQEVSFGYVDRQSRTTRRRVEPHGLVHTGSRWYLVAYDLERDDWRTFRIDRIEGEATLADRFSPRA